MPQPFGLVWDQNGPLGALRPPGVLASPSLLALPVLRALVYSGTANPAVA